MTQYKKGLDLYHPQMFDTFFSSVRKSNGLVQVLEASHFLDKGIIHDTQNGHSL